MYAVTLLLGLSTVLGQAPSPETVPNRVFWICIDSLRADHLHFAGYERETSPWLDDLAPRSAVFTHAYAPASSTPFSVGATFGGRYYSLMDHESHPAHIPSSVPTLAETMKAGGLATFAWISNAYLVHTRENGYDRGFDVWQRILTRGSPTATIDEIAAVVDESYRPSGGAEFHYIHTMDVHHPYAPPIPYDRLWPDVEPTEWITFGEPIDVSGERILSNWPFHSEAHDLDADDIAYLISQYDGTIRYTDARLSALLDAFSYDPDADLLIVSSDHGEQFFERGLWGHGRSVYPAETHVPLLIHGPGVAATFHETPVNLVDLYPTLCELYGIQPPKGLHGVSLLPALRGAAELSARPVYTENPYWTGGVFAPEAAVIVDNDFYRILTNLHWRQPWRIWPIEEELFRLGGLFIPSENEVSARVQRANELNAVLRTINPRFAAYTHTAIRVADGGVTFGPERVQTGAKRVRLFSTSIDRPSADSVELTVPKSDAVVHVTTEARKPHLLRFAYRLEGGTIRLALGDSSSPEVAWEHTIRKERTDWTAFEAMVTPATASTTITLTATGLDETVFHIKDISLREAKIPVFEQVEWERGKALRDEAIDDVSVREALDALGYLD